MACHITAKSQVKLQTAGEFNARIQRLLEMGYLTLLLLHKQLCLVLCSALELHPSTSSFFPLARLSIADFRF